MTIELRYDRVLIDPDPEALLAALWEAADAANEGANGRTCEPPALAELPGGAEGVFWRHGGVPLFPNSWARTSKLGVAWWTDPPGRKHVRVCSSRDRIRGDPAPIFGRPSDCRPPVACVYPCRVRWTGRRALARCGCGREGTVQSIGWDGERCDPCRDRDLQRLRDEYEQQTGFLPFDPAPASAAGR